MASSGFLPCRPVKSADAQLIVAVAAPLETTLVTVEKVFWARLAALLVIALVSALLARLYLYRLIESWVADLSKASADVAQGNLMARVSTKEVPRELNMLEFPFQRYGDCTLPS
jgi:nitrogen fixation/metabolism regulation signal transduction histidine kinase